MNNLIVGSGLSGSTLARKLAEYGENVTVIDKRDHIGGNVYDYIDKETGIRVSKYGAHIFHTNNERVWNFVNSFSKWIPYEHRVLSYVNGVYVPVPVNITTVNTLFNLNIKTEKEMILWLEKVQIKGKIENSKDAALSRVGEKLYKLMFENYTKKQWAINPEKLEPSVLERIPVRTNFNDRYFSDKYEGLPKDGYTNLVKNILDHKNIKVFLNTEFSGQKADRIFFTGKIDSYFADKFGKLEYRSLKFKKRIYTIDSYQPAAVCNYPSLEYPFTRKIEYKKFYNQQSDKTIVYEEFSTDVGEEYYPIPTQRNRDIYKKYQREAKKLEKDGVYFLGRLAEYKYYNMDQAIASSLELFDKIS